MGKAAFLLVGVLFVFGAFGTQAAEHLTLAEQSFEDGATPAEWGRWTAFTWPNSSGESEKIPSGLGDTENVSGGVIEVATADNAGLVGWGSSALYLTNTVMDGDPDSGGIYIQIPVVNGATYTVSAHFYGADRNAWNYSLGISVDTDGGSTSPSDVDYGYGRTGGLNEEFDPNRGADYLVGDWMWNEGGDGSNEEQWFDSSQITVDVLATGDQMTVYLWGLSKGTELDAMVDGVSIQGPEYIPPTATPIPTGAPPASSDDWSAYR